MAPSLRAASRMGAAALAPPCATARIIRAAQSCTLAAAWLKRLKRGLPRTAASCRGSSDTCLSERSPLDAECSNLSCAQPAQVPAADER